jgi:RNA polymerase sigma-70 factor, ECF subfamily
MEYIGRIYGQVEFFRPCKDKVKNNMRIFFLSNDVLHIEAFKYTKGVYCMKITSDNFIKYLKKGKESALEYVIEEYAGIVKAVVYNALKSYKDSYMIEECVSDVFIGAYENAKQFEGDEEDFRKWLCTIAKFKAVDKQRKLAKNPAVTEIDEIRSAVLSAEEEFLLKSDTHDLMKMMKKLDKTDCEIFVMKYFLNMKNEDIGKTVGMTKAAVDNRLYRGKKTLRKIYVGGAFNEEGV